MGRTAQRLAVLSAAAGLLASCAVQEPPPGGPEDRTGPRVVVTVPAADSAGVARSVAPELVFSEKVDPASFKNRVFVYPPVAFDKISVRGDRLSVRFKGELPDTTICLLVRPGILDYHRVPSRDNFFLYFSTDTAMAAGDISGVIQFKDKPDTAGVAELFAVPRDTVFDVRRARRVRVAFAGRDGSFDLRFLPDDGARFFLRAFTDRDGDARYSEGKEFATLYPDTIVLDPSRPRAEGIRITIIDPNEPGSLAGTVVDETGFRVPPTVRLSPAWAEGKPLVARADSLGAFKVGAVPPGPYLFSAFVDLKPDSLCGSYPSPTDSTITLTEPCVTLADTLRFAPGEAKKIEPVKLVK